MRGRALLGGRVVAGLAAGLLLWAVTGLPVMGLTAATLILLAPMLFNPGSAETQELRRLEAVEEWTRRLADVVMAGSGLEKAIRSSVTTAPDAIRPSIIALNSRLAAGAPLAVALRGLADDLNSPAGDRVAAALLLSSARRGPGLSQSLKALAATVAEEVTMRRAVEADRAKPRKNARQLMVVACVYIAVILTNDQFAGPYHEPLGQLVLFALMSWFVGCLVLMWKMSQPAAPVRFLTGRRQ